MKFCLQINGETRYFSEREMIAIVEKYYAIEAEEAKRRYKTATTPMEGRAFKVNPMKINCSLFDQKRKDPNQEKTRQIILAGFAEVKKNPQRYNKPFKTIIPKKTWAGCKKVEELIEMANDLGDHMADWVEQSLEWAQRIQNGETWETVCNKADKSKTQKMVIWKDNAVHAVGSVYGFFPPSDVSPQSYCLDETTDTVPNVVQYD